MKVPKQSHKGPQGSQPRRRATQGATTRRATGSDATAGNSVRSASLDRSGVKAQYYQNTRLRSRTATRGFKGGVRSNQPPVINTHPQDQTVDIGVSASFTVDATATGGGNLNYQWQASRQPDGPWRPIPDSNDATLTFTSAEWQDNGWVRCRVTDSTGVAFSDPAQLTVVEFPSIDTQPDDVTVEAPGEAEFTIVASHSGGEPAYLWQADEGGGSWVNAGNVLSNASGMTTDTLTCATTAAADNGTDLRCRVRSPDNNVDSTVYSDVVTLTVTTP